MQKRIWYHRVENCRVRKMKVNLDNSHCLLTSFLLCPGEYRDFKAIDGKDNGCKRIWYHRVENCRVRKMKVNLDNAHRLLPSILLCPGEYREYDAIEGKDNGCKRIWYYRVEDCEYVKWKSNSIIYIVCCLLFLWRIQRIYSK